MAISSAPVAMPRAWAATLGREASSVFIATMKPRPSPMMRLSLWTRQSWKTSSRVAEARMPILFSFLPKLKPSAPFSTMKKEAPRGPLLLSVMAQIV